MGIWAHLHENADRRRRAGLRRTLTYRPPTSARVDLSSNDYLSLNGDRRLARAASEAVHTWGTGSTASRLVTGSTELHRDLEQALCEHTGLESAVVFSSGYTANIGAVTALADDRTLVVSDAHNHASLIDACRLARATVRIVPHLDHDAVARALAERSEPRALVVTESVFSVDGDASDLAALAGIAGQHGAALLVDEAHSLGVVGAGGRGAVAAAGLADSEHVVVTATLSKALASAGGAVLGQRVVTDHVIDTARTFIFDTALAPASVAAALAALTVLREEPQRAARVREVAVRLADTARAAGWDATEPEGAVVSLRIGGPEAAVSEQKRWLEAGVQAGVFRPPSVPDGVSRLRLTAHADMSEEDFATVSALLHGSRSTGSEGPWTGSEGAYREPE